MKLSIVTSMYRSEQYIDEFIERAKRTAKAAFSNHEFILVNDGCPGNSLEAALKIAGENDSVKVVELSRNFGHHAALFAGLEAADGDMVFLIDCDLEESPEWLQEFKDSLIETDSDLVYGVQGSRPGGIRNNLSKSFYYLFNKLSETKIPENVCTVRLMTREYRDAIVSMQEKNLFLAGMFAWAGFKQTALPVEKKSRETRSGYSVRRMLNLLVDAVTSFSPFPLYLSFFTGLVISTLAGCFGLFLIVRKILQPDVILTGYVSLLTSIFFVGGLIILMTGVIGIYLSKLFVEVKQRPLYFIRSKHGFDKE